MDIPNTKEKIEEYMLRHNRPYSVTDILNNFQSTMRRKQAEAALDMLVEENAITLKEYGKAKVFLINQDRFPEVDTELLGKLDEQINLRREEFNKLNEEAKELKKILEDSTSSHTN